MSRHPSIPTGLKLFALVGVASMSIACSEPGLLQSPGAPSALTELEEYSEDLVDLAAGSNWQRAEVTSNAVRQVAARLEVSEGHVYPELEHAMTEFDRSIKARDTYRATTAANEVNREVVVLATPYLNQSAISVLRLDLEGREVQIHARADPSRANEAVARIVGIWNELRPTIAGPHREEVILRFDVQVDTLVNVHDSVERESAAGPFLDAVDLLEDLLIRGPQVADAVTTP